MDEPNLLKSLESEYQKRHSQKNYLQTGQNLDKTNKTEKQEEVSQKVALQNYIDGEEEIKELDIGVLPSKHKSHAAMDNDNNTKA